MTSTISERATVWRLSGISSWPGDFFLEISIWAACGFWRVAQLVVPSQIYGWWPVEFLEFLKISTNIMKGRTLLTNIKREPSVSVV